MKLSGGRKLKRSLKRLSRGDFSPFMRTSGNIIATEIPNNIKRQVEADGVTPLKRNAESTKKQKGHGISLVDKKVLISKSTYIVRPSKTMVKVSRKAIRKQIGKYLLDKGYLFWGISNRMRGKIFKGWVSLMRSWI